MTPVFVVIELYGSIAQEVYVYTRFEDAKTHWEKATGLDWSENEAYDAETHEKEEYMLIETSLLPDFNEEVVK